MSEHALLEPAKDLKIGMVLQDRYRIVRKIGEGGMGSVYEGQHTLINRRVAIKCLHTQFASNAEIVARFQNEAMAANSIRHQNIIEVTDLGRFDDGTVFMVLEFLEGRELADLIVKDGPQPLGRMVHIISQVCDALTAAHAQGIVHRDLKPENIFLIPRGEDSDFVKVLDFGIAKFREGASKGMTRTGTTLGTPYYMAPEQAQAKRDLDGRADIYSMGVIVFHALTGQHPFDDESYPMLVVKICTEPPPPLRNYRPDLPPEFEAVVNRMLSKNPEQRYASCQEVKEALRPFRAHFGAPVLAEGVLPTAKIAPTQQLDSSGIRSHGGGLPTSAGNPLSMTPQPGQPAIGVPAHPTPHAMSGDYSPPSSKLPLVLGLVAIVMGVLGGGAALAIFLLPSDDEAVAVNDAPDEDSDPTSDDEPPRDPEPTPPPEPDERPATTTEAGSVTELDTAPADGVERVRLILVTEPANAEIFIDGDSVGSNGFNALLPQGEALEVEVRAEGHETLTRTLTPRFDGQVLTLTLDRERGVRGPRTTTPTRMTETTTTMAEPTMVVAPPDPVPTPTPTMTVMEGFMDVAL
jgi:serine/threonine-protein kinase